MQKFLNKTRTYIITHKKTSAFILIVILLLGYWIYKKINNTSGETRYVTSTVNKNTIISSVAGSGQVSASSQVDLKPNVSGTITYIGVTPGEQVTSGKTLFIIDDKNAQKTLRDAQISLESAKLSLEKIQIQNSNENTNATLEKAYSDGLSSVSSAFLDIPQEITGLDDLFSKQNLSDNTARNSGITAQNYRSNAESAYYSAKTAYDKNKNNFNVLNYNSKKSDIDAVIKETYDTSKLLASAIKNMNNFINYLAADTGNPADFTSYQDTLSTYTNTINGHISSLMSAQTTIRSYKDSLPNNNIDLKNSQITVTQRENAVIDAIEALNDYIISAPFNGKISSVPVQKGITASSGTILGTIITSSKLANISLNEVDVAKIELGQKATLTFDAIPNLTITGKVTQIDSIGTVSQGVVNYNVQIAFDTSDNQIKPGMSVSASIITNVKQDILTIPSSAIKTQNGTSYVQIFERPLPKPTQGIQGSTSVTPPINQNVETGISNDTSTEIISGLKEGDNIVTKTITAKTTTTTTAPSIFGAATGNRAGGAAAGNARALRGD